MPGANLPSTIDELEDKERDFKEPVGGLPAPLGGLAGSTPAEAVGDVVAVKALTGAVPRGSTSVGADAIGQSCDKAAPHDPQNRLVWGFTKEHAGHSAIGYLGYCIAQWRLPGKVQD